MKIMEKLTQVNKTENLWGILEKRYGKITLRDGQSEGAIKQIWVKVLGDYSNNDLIDAALHYIANSQKPYWPEEGHILAILKRWGCKHEQPDNALPNPMKESASAFHDWYQRIIVNWPDHLETGASEGCFKRILERSAVFNEWCLAYRKKNALKVVSCDVARVMYRDGVCDEFIRWIKDGVEPKWVLGGVGVSQK